MYRKPNPALGAILILAITLPLLSGCGTDAETLAQIKELAEQSLPLAQDFAAVLPKITAKAEADTALVNRVLVSHQNSLAKSARAWNNLYKAAQNSKVTKLAVQNVQADVESSALELQVWTQIVGRLNVTDEYAKSHTQDLQKHLELVQAIAERFDSLTKKKPAPTETKSP